ncbi:MAG TPA: GH92 family glycosyl hydrolase [Bacteroidota bacterium]|nr:GH92 family glycosyl hydrolase [Bacteroidota bacterium]
MKTSFIVLAIAGSATASHVAAEDNDVAYVNPLIGTAPSHTISALAHGSGSENNAQVIPSVTMPFGMTNWTPQTRHVETKCTAPYYYADTLITGFRGSHWLSGSCTQDYGSVTVMPLNDTKMMAADKRGSHFSHANEQSTPYYYKTVLEDSRIESEITSTARTGILRFTFSDTDSGVVAIEPNSDFAEGFIQIIPERNECVGYNPVHRIYQGWGTLAGFKGYFVARFDRAFDAYGTYFGREIQYGQKELSHHPGLGGFVSFALHGSRTIIVKVGTSFTSIDEARKNLDAETRTVDFDSAKAVSKAVWNRMLSVIDIGAAAADEKTKFYTALYHSLLQPRVYNDYDGSYPGFAGSDSVYHSGKHNYYDDFSLWDTYRALHPLYNLLLPEQSADMMRSLLAKGAQGGWLPIFPCWNSYTSAMIGDHGISVIADAYSKGVIDLTESEYQLLKKNATQSPLSYAEYANGKGRRALQSYMKYGYIPLEDSVKESFHKGEQVSRTLEYAYDDFALSAIAKKMGKEEDARYFLSRSENYRHVYDTSVSCVRGRFADGTFTDTFRKTERMPYITEGTPWQYTWYVPHDIEGLIGLMGGREKFNRNLDEFFAAGQYWHGNEPGHQIPFLYAYSGQMEKTKKIVDKILHEEYSSDPGGLSGNDDSGQMSAWYVFAALGLYPVCPAKDEYAVFLPAFEKITLHFQNGRTLVIAADGMRSGSTRVKEITLNGVPIRGATLSHSELLKGGTLEFVMEGNK